MPETGNSASAREFDLIIVGAGSGNSLIGPDFDELSIALIDDGEHFGGTCLNAGCIPSKMFVHVADVATDAREATRLGLTVSVAADWPAIRDRVFTRTDAISSGGLDYRQNGSANVTLYRESFGFVDQHTLVGASGQRITGERIVIAAGSRPAVLPAAHRPGSLVDDRAIDDRAIYDCAIYDSDSIMRIENLPASLIIVGGGAIAAEFAHVFSALGVEITLVTRSRRLLTAMDDDVSELFTSIGNLRWTHIAEDTVDAIERVGIDEDGAEEGGAELAVKLASGGTVSAEAVLVALGRTPNTDTIAAASVGFDLHDDGRIQVDARQRVLAGGTPLDGVYALGDVSSAHQLKHVANHEARVVAHNLAHPDDLVGGDPGPVPSAIFSHPEVATFGLTERAAEAAGERFVVVTQYYRDTAYGWALEDAGSFCKLVVDAPGGRILGAHIIGPNASILLQPLLQAASAGLSVRGLARSQYWPHPALTEVVENALLKAEGAL